MWKLIHFLTPLSHSPPFWLAYIPHGHCYLWHQGLVSLHVISDSLIGLSYYSIPLLLLYFVRKRQDLPFHGIFLLFSAFIVACGTTHLLEIWTLWHPDYWLSGTIKAIAAGISVYTAIALIPLIPQLLEFPSPSQLAAANFNLQQQVEERIATETALRESELRYYSLTRISPVGIFRTDAKGNCLYVNERWSELAGMTPEAALGEGWVSALHPDDSERVFALWYAWANSAETIEQPFKGEYRFIRPDGTISWVFGQAVAEKDDCGEIIGYVGAIADISDRVEAEIALRRAYEDLENRVQKRTLELSQANIALQSEIAEREWAQRGLMVQYATSLVLANAETLDEMPGQILEAIAANLGWDWSEFWTIDAQTNVLRCTHTWNGLEIESSEFEAITSELSFTTGVGLPGRVWASFAPVWIEDVALDENFIRREICGEIGLHAALAFPILIGKEILAVIACFSHERLVPDADLMQIMTTIGNQIGQFIKRKRAEATIQEIAALQYAVLNSANYSIISTDVNGIILTFNAAAQQMLGYTAAEIIGKTTPEIIHDRDEVVARAQELSQEFGTIVEPGFDVFVAKAKRGEVEEREWTYIRKNGDRFSVLLSVTTLHDVENNITGFLGIASDITERKQSQEALRKYAAEVEDLYNNSPCGYHSLDENGIVVRINDTELKMLGYRREEVVGEKFTKLLASESLPVFEQIFFQLKRYGWVRDVEYQMLRADGTKLPVLLNGTAVKDEDGNFLMSRATLFDISDRKRAEAALQQSESTLRSFFDSAPMMMGIVELTDNDDILLISHNAATASYWELPLDAMKNRRASELGTPLQYVRLWLEYYRESLETKAPVRFEYCHEDWRSTRWLSATVCPIAIASGTRPRFAFIVEDISDRKQAEAALKESEQRWQLAVVGSNDGTWDWNIKTNEVFLSVRWKEMLGYENSEISDSFDEWLNRVHPDDLEYALQAIQDHLGGQTSFYSIEHRLRCKDGNYKWILSRGQALWDERGTPVRMVGSHTDISDRKRYESEIIWQETLLRSMANASPLAFYVVDERTDNVLYFNRRFCEIWGIECTTAPLSSDEIEQRMSTTCGDCIPADISDFICKSQALRCEENRLLVEDEIALNDGRVIRRFSAQIRDNSDQYFGRLYLFEDITERKQAEQERLQLLAQEKAARAEIEAAKNRISNILESITDAFFTLDKDWKFTYINPQALEILRVTKEEIIGNNVWNFFSNAVGMKYYREYHKAVSEQISVEFEEFYPPLDIWTEVHAYPNQDGLAVYFQDITARKRAEAERLNLSRALEVAVVGTSQFDLQGNFVMVNPASASLLGYQPEELIGRNWQLTVPPEDREKILEAYQQMLAHERAEVETKAVRKDGSIFDQKLVMVKAYDQQEQWIGHYGFMKDISDRCEVERLKDEFVSIVSHELRTPLTSIAGALDLLAAGVLQTQPQEAQRMLTIAANNTERLVRLINDILDIERIKSGKVTMMKVACNVADLIEQAAEVMEEMAKAAGVTLSVYPLSVSLWADPDRMIQVLTNLLSNAIKFSAPNSTVFLSAELISSPVASVDVSTQSSREIPDAPEASDRLSTKFTSSRLEAQILFKVKDTGRGIPADKLQAIFEPFQQVDASDSRQKGGTGLGLAICRSIVQHHEGQIWVESTLGEGSTFYISLPAILEPDATDEAIPAESFANAEEYMPLILACDDDLDILAVVQTMLQQQGYRIITVSSGQEAVQQATAHRPDAILLNLRMPGMNGWETLAVLKQQPETKHIPAIILSGLLPDRIPHPSISSWIVKPPDPDSLSLAIKRALAKQDRAIKVLVVEDDQDLAQVLIAMFERHGIETFYARTGRAALQLSQRLTPDLLILDLGLPELDGFAVVDWLRQHNRLCEVPVVVYTARDLLEGDRERLKLGQTLFFTKGRITPQEFEHRVINLLNRMTRGCQGDTLLHKLRIFDDQFDRE
jgi:PAS domain S-box-containing protein